MSAGGEAPEERETVTGPPVSTLPRPRVKKGAAAHPPPDPCGSAGGCLRQIWAALEWLLTGGETYLGAATCTMLGRDCEAHLRRTRPDLYARARPTPQPERPRIRVSARPRRDITDDALAALAATNDPPRYYCLGSEVVRLREGRAEPLSPAALSGVLDRVANFVAEKGDREYPARPPQDVVSDILSLPRLPLPSLRGIYRHPLLTASGLLAREGYDSRTGLYLHLDGLEGVRTDLPIEEARRLLLEEVLGDFPFEGEADRAHAVAAILQRYVREIIGGPTPLYLVEAPAPGTGKGLLVEVISIITAGESAPVMALAPEEAEVEKRITAALLESPGLLLLDNARAIKSSALSAALTAEEWRGRRLGQSEIVRCPNRATWIATGNNVELSREVARRVAPIRLDAIMEHPEERTGFRHPDLPGWVREHRADLVSACLSLIEAWRRAGSPRSSVTLGRYEAWAATMGGILGVAGIPGLLGNRETIHLSDRETGEWSAFLEVWEATHKSEAITAGQLLDVARAENLLPEMWAGKSALAGTQRLGHALMARRGRVFGGRVIVLAGRGHPTRNLTWRVAPARPKGDGTKHPETPPTEQTGPDGEGTKHPETPQEKGEGVFGGVLPHHPPGEWLFTEDLLPFTGTDGKTWGPFRAREPVPPDLPQEDFKRLLFRQGTIGQRPTPEDGA